MTDQPWDRSDYQRIVAVRYADSRLTVRFGDGSCATVEARQLLPAGSSDARWADLSFDGYEVVVPSAQGNRTIPWSAIRLATDAAFRHRVDEMATDQARQIGRRITALRARRSLNLQQLSKHTGIAASELAAIERGEFVLTTTPLHAILSALGATWRDLAGPAEATPERLSAT